MPTFTGNGSANTLNGSLDDDDLFGLGGNDVLNGGGGQDNLFGGTGNDTYKYEIGGGDDVFNEEGSSSLSDKILMGPGFTIADIARLVTDGNSLFIELVNGNRITLSDQLFDASSEIETLQFSGGATIDLRNDVGQIYYGTDGADNISAAGGDDTVFAGAGDDIVNGGDDSDTLVGDLGDDTLSGGAAADTLNGGLGDDTLNGGTGNDTYRYDSGGGDDIFNEEGSSSTGDKVLLGPGFTAADIARLVTDGNSLFIDLVNGNRITLTDQLFDPSYEIETLQFSGGATIDLRNDLAQTYFGTDRNDSINAAGGNDKVSGGAGDDTLIGEDGNDVLSGGGGRDSLRGDSGTDSLDGGKGSDLISGGIGNDIYRYSAGGGNDTFNEESAGSAGDRISMAAGMTIANISRFVTDGIDLYIDLADGSRITLASQVFDTSSEIETLLFSNGTSLTLRNNAAQTYFGTAGNDTIDAAGGDDTVNGGGGGDNLNGGSGLDRLSGGAGADSLTGGTSADTFVFELPTQGRDIILDFSRGQGDKVEIDASNFGGGLAAGPLVASQFTTSAFSGTGQRFFYNNTNDTLYFDADGNGAASVTVALATFDNGFNLAFGDIILVA